MVKPATRIRRKASEAAPKHQEYAGVAVNALSPAEEKEKLVAIQQRHASNMNLLHNLMDPSERDPVPIGSREVVPLFLRTTREMNFARRLDGNVNLPETDDTGYGSVSVATPRVDYHLYRTGTQTITWAFNGAPPPSGSQLFYAVELPNPDGFANSLAYIADDGSGNLWRQATLPVAVAASISGAPDPGSLAYVPWYATAYTAGSAANLTFTLYPPNSDFGLSTAITAYGLVIDGSGNLKVVAGTTASVSTVAIGSGEDLVAVAFKIADTGLDVPYVRIRCNTNLAAQTNQVSYATCLVGSPVDTLPLPRDMNTVQTTGMYIWSQSVGPIIDVQGTSGASQLAAYGKYASSPSLVGDMTDNGKRSRKGKLTQGLWSFWCPSEVARYKESHRRFKKPIGCDNIVHVFSVKKSGVTDMNVETGIIINFTTNAQDRNAVTPVAVNVTYVLAALSLIPNNLENDTHEAVLAKMKRALKAVAPYLHKAVKYGAPLLLSGLAAI